VLALGGSRHPSGREHLQSFTGTPKIYLAYRAP